MDNLESHTYEVFEKDPVKYSEYQKAIFYALRDRVPDSEAATSITYVICLLTVFLLRNLYIWRLKPVVRLMSVLIFDFLSLYVWERAPEDF